MKTKTIAALLLAGLAAAGCMNRQTDDTQMQTLRLTRDWDKTFPQSDKVRHTKITFRNRFGITLAEIGRASCRERV